MTKKKMNIYATAVHPYSYIVKLATQTHEYLCLFDSLITYKD